MLRRQTSGLEKTLRRPHILGCPSAETASPQTMSTTPRVRRSTPAHLGFLLDELRRAGVTTYSELASTLNRQGIRPARGRWSAHELHLLMRRHRRAHPAAVDD